MFEYRARIGYTSPRVIDLNAYEFYRIVAGTGPHRLG